MILVTGGLGFIGSNFVSMHIQKEFLQNKEIVIVDNLTYAANRTQLEVFSGINSLNVHIEDVTNIDKMRSLISKCTGVIHFAAETHVDRSLTTPENFVNTNIIGTWNLVKWADYFKKRILVVSTDEVYGSIADGKFFESDKLNPSSPYSASKAAADLLALSYFKTFGTDVVITRCTNNYGKFQNEEKLIPTIIRKLSLDQKIPLYGNGLNIRNWISVEDHCLGIAAAYSIGRTGEIYNFGTDDYLTNLQLCELFLNQMNKSQDCIEYVEDRKGHDFRYSVDFSKSQYELNWFPKHKIKDKIADLVQEYSI